MTADPDISYTILEVAHAAVSVAASGNNTSSAIDLRKAREVTWYARNGSGDNVNFQVLTSPDGVTYDTESFENFYLDANGARTKRLDSSLRYAKIKVINNDTVNASIVSTGFYGKQ